MKLGLKKNGRRAEAPERSKGVFKSRGERRQRREEPDENDEEEDGGPDYEDEDDRERNRNKGARAKSSGPREIAPPEDLFDGMEQATVRGEWNYVRPGDYICQIKRIKTKRSRQKRWYLGVEARVVHVIDDDEGRGHDVGDDVSHMINAEGDYFLSEVKTMYANICACDPSEITRDICKQIAGPDNPLAGVIVRIKGKNKVTKKGNDFTTVTYKRVPAAKAASMLSDDEIEAFFPKGKLDALIETEAEEGLDVTEDEDEPVLPRKSKGSKGGKKRREEPEEEVEEINPDEEDADEHEETEGVDDDLPAKRKPLFKAKAKSRSRD